MISCGWNTGAGAARWFDFIKYDWATTICENRTLNWEEILEFSKFGE